MSSQTAVSIFMGSKSDLPVVQAAADTLAEFDISYQHVHPFCSSNTRRGSKNY